MLQNVNVRILIIGILMGSMISAGTYFLLPPPQNAYAQNCARSYDVVQAIQRCLDDATVRYGTISTNC